MNLQILSRISLILFLPSLSSANYFDDYLKCLKQENPETRAECLQYVSSLRKTYGTNAIHFLSLAAIPCENESSGQYFTGTGIVIDTNSCGQRSGCGTNNNQCVDTSTTTFTDNKPNQPFAEWCEDCCTAEACDQKGCLVCKERKSVVTEVKSFSRRGILGILKCFATGQSFEQPAIFKTLAKTYAHFLARGFKISCPSDAADYHPHANADYKTGILNFYPAFFSSGDLNMKSTVGHEFLHLSRILGPQYQVDNQTVATHNKAYEKEQYKFNAAGDFVSQGDKRELANIDYDRVYACEDLCFARDYVTLEKCNLCMTYAEKNSSKGHKACEKLIDRKSLNSFEESKRTVIPYLNEYNSLYAKKRQFYLDQPSQFQDDFFSKTPSTEFENVKNKINRVDAAFNTHTDLILKWQNTDQRNVLPLRSRYRADRLLALQYLFTSSCDLVRQIETSVGKCRMNCSEFRTSVKKAEDYLYSRLRNGISQWNELAKLPPEDPDGGSTILLEVSEPESMICRKVPTPVYVNPVKAARDY